MRRRAVCRSLIRWPTWLAAAGLSLVLVGACAREVTAPVGPRRVGQWETFGRVRDRWYTPQPGYAAACPVIAGDIVVFGTGDGQLVGRDRATGAARWRTVVNPAGRAVDAPLLAVDDVVVALAEYSTVGLDRSTGHVLWSYEAPIDSLGPFDLPPAPGYLARNAAATDAAGTVYVPAWGGSVSAVDVSSGTPRWVWRLDPSHPYGSGATGTAVAGDTVFAALYQMTNKSGTERRGWLVSFDRTSGEQFQRVLLPLAPSSVGGRIIVTPRLVVVTSGGAGQLAAVDRWTSDLVWRFSPPPDQYGFQYASSSGVGGDVEMIFQDGGNDRLYALRTATGEQVWENDGYGVSMTPTASARRTYVSNGWALSVHDRNDGGVVVKVAQGHGVSNTDALLGCVTVAGDEVYVTAAGAAWSFWEP